MVGPVLSGDLTLYSGKLIINIAELKGYKNNVNVIYFDHIYLLYTVR